MIVIPQKHLARYKHTSVKVAKGMKISSRTACLIFFVSVSLRTTHYDRHITTVILNIIKSGRREISLQKDKILFAIFRLLAHAELQAMRLQPTRLLGGSFKG